jgi:hypothetical protein
MPMVLAPAIAAAGVTGSLAIPGIGSITYASIAAYGISLGATVGSSLLLRSLQHRQHQNNQITVRQALTPRVRGYGRVKMGGAMFYSGANRTLVQGIVFCEGPIDGFEEVWLNDKKCPYTPGTYFTFGGWNWTNYVTVNLGRGVVPQSVSPAFASAGHYWWDSTHQLNGLAYAVLTCNLPSNATKNFTNTYQNGVPAVRVVARLLQVYDPRNGQTYWSDNPALCIRDFLTSSRGYNIPASRINDASFIAFANICDQQVPNTNAPSGYENRYSFWGTYTLDEEPRAVLERLLASCDGEIIQFPDGTVGIRGGQWDAPTVTISDAIILSYEVQQGNDKLSAFNQYRIRYIDSSYWGDYQVIEGYTWDDTAAQTASGQVLPRDFDGTFCASYMQARRLAKIAMHKNNPQWLLTIHTTLAGLDALGERIVTVVIAELGINTTFFVSKFEIDGDFKGCTLTLASLDSSAYEWNTSEEASSTTNPEPGNLSYTIPTVTGLSLSVIRTIVSGAQTGVQVAAQVTPPADLTYSLLTQISGDGGSTWVDMTPTGAWSSISGLLTDTVTYKVRAALQSSPGVVGPYATQTITLLPSALGPVASALAAGTNVDLGLASASVTESDDFGLASDGSLSQIDLGLA